ncbi:MAG: tetratricopeptide repeat protein [Acidobacteria bacterium]|nr:tetratricopeptide repeat protein [Acidobacteriota bacterium]
MIPRFVNFARSQLDSKNPMHRVEARYLLALVAKRAGNAAEARQLLEQAVAIQPDAIPPRLELRGDVVDPLVP